MKTQVESSADSFGESYLYLQFTPKYRRNVFMDRFIQKVCGASFREVAWKLWVRLEVCEFGPDHIHIFIDEWKIYTIPQLAQFFKGNSSKEVR
ncbi:MAG: transposase [Candidatus Aenigmarchaeota archaeon]|nr:transposase [Candidatus Aenigmarchaeota archaeon]